MSLFAPVNSFGWHWSGWDAVPTQNSRVLLTTGTGTAKGTYVQVATAANIAQEVQWIDVDIHTSNQATVDRSTLVDVGVDPAGGTSAASAVTVISDLIGGGVPVWYNVVPLTYSFPLKINAGASIWLRAAGAATGQQIRATVRVSGQPSAPEALFVGSAVETVGTVTGASGVSVTPGTAGWGSWTSVGTTVKTLKHWNFGIGVANATIANLMYVFQFGYGDGTNIVQIGRDIQMCTTTAEVIARQNMPVYHHVPAGSTIYCRAICSGTPDTGINVLAYGTA